MSNTKHTPGPWKAVYIGCGDWDLDIPATEENFRLAAAAPDLLDAALAVVQMRDDGMSEHDRVMFVDDGIKQLRTAIAKATGSAE